MTALPANSFKARLRQRPPMIGSWLMSASPLAAEAMGWAGFDWLVVDMEHVPLDMGDVLAHLQAIAATPASAVVRVPWNDAVMVKRALDAGAQTIMFPFVQTPEEAARAVAATRYPPEGVRGIAAMTRAARYATIKDYLKTANREIAVIIQLETPEAIARMDEIAAVPGVDALFIGPGDLSGAMGQIGQIGHPAVQQALAQAAGRAKALGKPVGIVGPNPDMVKAFADMGFDYLAVSSDMGLMMNLAQSWLTALRGAHKGTDENSGGPY